MAVFVVMIGTHSAFHNLLFSPYMSQFSSFLLSFLSGCGNSSMSGDMYSAGYHSITNIDYSSVCINTMSARYSNCPGMTWHEMDVRQLSFPDAFFDVVLEKATLDALMVEEKSPLDVSPQTACFIHKALTEVLLKICESSLGLNISSIKTQSFIGNS